MSFCIVVIIDMKSVAHLPPHLRILQWSDSAALDVIHHILSNLGPDASCLFVGSYRSNEVSSDHPIFSLMKDLEASKVSTQKLMLEGVKYEDMNTQI